MITITYGSGGAFASLVAAWATLPATMLDDYTFNLRVEKLYPSPTFMPAFIPSY